MKNYKDIVKDNMPALIANIINEINGNDTILVISALIAVIGMIVDDLNLSKEERVNLCSKLHLAINMIEEKTKINLQ